MLKRSALRVALVLALALTACVAFAANASAATNPQVATNYYFSCALLNSGTVNCWGNNSEGQLGDGTSTERLTPGPVSGITDATALTTGDGHACVIVADQTVRCWGDNGSGQAGDGTDNNDRLTPVAPIGVSGAKQISSSDYTNCAVLADSTITCWGSNPNDVMGRGNTSNVTTPVSVPGFTNVVKVQAAPDNICALLATGTVKCSGTNDEGELGNGSIGGGSNVPVDVVEVSSAVDLAGGDEFACALISDGTVKCWGDGGNGKLGNGSTDDSGTPATVPGLTGVVQIAAQYDSICALINDGTVRCWGDNSNGQAGTGAYGDANTPQVVNGLSNVVSLGVTGENTVCVIVLGGQVICWGQNDSGQIGNGVKGSDVLALTTVPNLNVNVVPYPAVQSAVTVTGKAKTDRKKKNYTVSGNFSLTPAPFVGTAVCAGNVTVSTKYKYTALKTVKKKGKKVKKKVTKTKTIKTSPDLTVAGATCSAKFTFKKLPVKYLNKKKIAITAAFAGNAGLEAATASTSYKLPKVSLKKKKSKKK